MGPVRFSRLRERLGSAVAILSAKGNDLRHVEGIGTEVSETILDWEKHVDLSAELKRVVNFGARVLIASDEEYPALLREIYDPPIVLYVFGKL